MNAVTPHLKSLIDPDDVVLDVGSGPSDPLRGIQCRALLRVDIWETILEKSIDFGIPIHLDARDLRRVFLPNSVDVVTCLDCIEHLERIDGLKLLDAMADIARKRMIVFTPEQWTDNAHHTNDPGCWAYGNEHNLHTSHWKAEDFEEPWRRIPYPGYLFAVMDI